MPRIGNDWGACDPGDPRNRRRRVSILVEAGDVAILVDTGPDCREQLLAAGIGQVDAVLYTHDHADHTHGIDDLRQLFHNSGKQVDCYAAPETWAVLRRRFDYVFEGTRFYSATAVAHDMPAELQVGSITVRPFRQNHGNIDSLGFRFEADGVVAAYSTDVKALPPESNAKLAGLDLWIVDALRRNPHPTHSHLEQTLGWIAAHRPRRAFLTHMDNSMDYSTLAAELPAGVEPAYDGLTVSLP